MLTTWLTLTLVLAGQEIVTTSTALYEAYTLQLNLWAVHALWFVFEIFDLAIGYYVGTWVQRHYASSAMVARTQRIAAALERHIGRYGKNLTLIVIGFFLFPYLSAFLVSWIAEPFVPLAVLLFIGDALYYATEWGIALGALQTFSGAVSALSAVLGLALLGALASKLVADRFLKDSEMEAP